MQLLPLSFPEKKKRKSKSSKSSKLCFFPYPGGKFYFTHLIIPIIENTPHQIYVEVFGGAGNILLNKKPSKIEIFNDIDDYIVSLFRVIRNPHKFSIFKKLLEFTPYSRTEFIYLKEKFKNNLYDIHPDIELSKAYIFYYLTLTSFSGKKETFSYTKSKKNKPQQYFNHIKKLILIKQRLENVIIENLDFQIIFEKYDTPNTLFYLDPPYFNIFNLYSFDFSLDDHKRLISCIKNAKGKIILSGYDNELYQNELSSLNKLEFQRKIFLTNSHQLPNHQRQIKTECIWTNFDFNFKL